MPMRIIAIPLLALTALLCGCGKGENEPGPGGVTVGEARALDEAAEMIESQTPIPVEESTAASENPEEQDDPAQ